MLDGLQIDRVAFTLPIGDGFPIFWYGILITIGIAIGAWWAAREIDRRGQSVDDLYNGLILVVFTGYFFARLTYVVLDIFDGASYDSFIDVINIRSGGVNILGGFVGAVLAGALYVRWRKLKFWHYADVAGPALLIAQAIGRWGNFINQELYGPPTDRPWGILIDPAFRLSQFRGLDPETRFHPTFLYESLALFVGFVLLIWLNHRYRDQWRPGVLFGAFLAWWGGNRVWIELFRPDQPAIGDSFVTYSMLAAFVLALAGVYVLLSRSGKLPDQDARRRSKRVLKPKPHRNDD
ncbi:MAG: prolipoprotein diacylglyceryl transferase [Chloroflexi bacterium]|nr:prolipoprotein diacylglyceryl transferase [Chloroflexota bacterium]